VVLLPEIIRQIQISGEIVMPIPGMGAVLIFGDLPDGRLPTSMLVTLE